MYKPINRIVRALLLAGALTVSSGPTGVAAPTTVSTGVSLPRLLTQFIPTLEQWVHDTLSDSTQTLVGHLRNDVPIESALPSARRAMRAGEPARARRLAEGALSGLKHDDPRYLRALDQAGYACWTAKDYAGAFKHLTTAERRAGTDALSPWRRAWIADAAFRLGDYDDAIRWAKSTQEVGDTYLPIHLANAASARAQAARTSAASPQVLGEFLTAHPEYPEARDAHVEFSLAWLRTGELTRAATAFDHAFQEYPWAPQAQRLKRALEQHPELREHLPTYSAEEQLERAKIWRNLRQWDTVERRLKTLLKQAVQDKDKDFAGRVRFELAMNAMEVGDYKLADQRFRELKRDGWAGIEAWEGLRYYGWNLARLHKHDEALKTLLLSAERQGGQEGLDARFEYLYDLGQYKEALQAHSKASRAEQVEAFRVVMMQYLAGDHRGALSAWQSMADRNTGHGRYQAQYWAGRSALKLGDVPTARKLWNGIVEKNPVDYYALLAASRIADLDAAKLHEAVDAGAAKLRRLPGRAHWRGAEDTKPADFSVARGEASNITAYASGLPTPQSLDELTETWGELFPDLHRADALVRIGADEDARHLYRRIVQEVRQLRASPRSPSAASPIALTGDRWAHMIDNRRGNEKRGWWGVELNTPAYPAPSTGKERRAEATRQREILNGGNALTDALIDIGRHLESHHVVRQLVLKERGLRGVPPTSGDRYDWFEAYPRPFPLTVLTHTRRANLNPYLLWATIIVESNMNPDAISHASAYGLTQVISKTGDRLAWELDDTTFGIHSLLDPHISIRYGAWYLGKLTAKFDHQESLALVGYNAGPHRVARWMDWRGHGLDADEFHEMVPFRGARNYQKQILRYMATYQVLYEDALSIYIGLDLLLDYDEAVNF